MAGYEAEYKHRGDAVDYTPSSDVDAGEVVVQGDLVGIAKRNITADVLGALAVKGVFDMAKATGSSSALTAGAKVYWDAASDIVTATVGANKYVGKVVEAAGADDETVRVRLEQ